jgi:hypothetical protein
MNVNLFLAATQASHLLGPCGWVSGVRRGTNIGPILHSSEGVTAVHTVAVWEEGEVATLQASTCMGHPVWVCGA